MAARVQIPSLASQQEELKMKRTGPTNKELRNLIQELKQLSLDQKVPVWKRIAKDLEKSTRQRRIINISKINRFSKANETIIVPGKVLGTGDINHNVTVAAWQFSESAKDKIKNFLSIKELMKINPQGKKLKILG